MNGKSQGSLKYVLKVGSTSYDIGSSTTSKTLTLSTLTAGDHTFEWSVAAFVDTLSRVSASQSFIVCVMGEPGSLTLISPKGSVNTANVTFSWKLSTWGHVCNTNNADLKYELYIQTSGQSAQLLGSYSSNGKLEYNATFATSSIAIWNSVSWYVVAVGAGGKRKTSASNNLILCINPVDVPTSFAMTNPYKTSIQCESGSNVNLAFQWTNPSN